MNPVGVTTHQSGTPSFFDCQRGGNDPELGSRPTDREPLVFYSIFSEGRFLLGVTTPTWGHDPKIGNPYFLDWVLLRVTIAIGGHTTPTWGNDPKKGNLIFCSTSNMPGAIAGVRGEGAAVPRADGLRAADLARRGRARPLPRPGRDGGP